MRTLCRAVIMGDRSGADGSHHFELNGEIEKLPADEVVEQFMDHLHDSEFLTNRYAYELNAAFKADEGRVVMAMGTVTIKDQRLPFMIMFSGEENAEA